MSRNFKVFLAIEGILALSFIQDLVRNPILVTLLIGSFIIMAVANKNNNHDLGKKALYLVFNSKRALSAARLVYVEHTAVRVEICRVNSVGERGFIAWRRVVRRTSRKKRKYKRGRAYKRNDFILHMRSPTLFYG